MKQEIIVLVGQVHITLHMLFGQDLKVAEILINLGIIQLSLFLNHQEFLQVDFPRRNLSWVEDQNSSR